MNLSQTQNQTQFMMVTESGVGGISCSRPPICLSSNIGLNPALTERHQPEKLNYRRVQALSRSLWHRKEGPFPKHAPRLVPVSSLFSLLGQVQSSMSLLPFSEQTPTWT